MERAGRKLIKKRPFLKDPDVNAFATAEEP